MALIKCENCGKNVSDKAKTCPHCGKVINQGAIRPSGSSISDNGSVTTSFNPKVKKKKTWIAVFLSIIAALALAFAGYFWQEGQRIPDSVRPLYEAANSGDADAQFKLGQYYSDYENADRNYKEAAKWLGKAAEQGHAEAQFKYGWLLHTDLVGDANIVEAVKWLRKSAEQGYDKAQMQLGDLYENGVGVSRDLPEALKWYRLAAEQGNEDAIDALKRLGY